PELGDGPARPRRAGHRDRAELSPARELRAQQRGVHGGDRVRRHERRLLGEGRALARARVRRPRPRRGPPPRAAANGAGDRVRRLIILLLLFAAMRLILPFGAEGQGSEALLSFGFLILAAYTVGEIGAAVRLPKIVG